MVKLYENYHVRIPKKSDLPNGAEGIEEKLEVGISLRPSLRLRFFDV